jgi:phosphoglycerol transferase MdoB-like AlkP superfamily enzyme
LNPHDIAMNGHLNAAGYITITFVALTALLSILLIGRFFARRTYLGKPLNWLILGACGAWIAVAAILLFVSMVPSNTTLSLPADHKNVTLSATPDSPPTHRYTPDDIARMLKR